MRIIALIAALAALMPAAANAQFAGLGNLGRALNGRVNATNEALRQTATAPRRGVPAAAVAVAKHRKKRAFVASPAVKLDTAKKPAVYVE